MITYTFLAIILIFSIYCFNDRNAMNKYMFHPYSIHHNKEHYRFLTHAFIHGDFMHLAFNCIALYGFGLGLEEQFFGNPNIFDPRLGKLYYILLFTGGIYAASFTEYYRNKDNPDYSSLGASGAISSILFCYIMISPLSSISFFFFPMKGWIAGVLLLGVSYFLIRRKKTSTYSDNISHESHFWGAIFGIAFILILKPKILLHFIDQIMSSFQ
ncbi:rhomboid family intramembrane serine protease [Aurantibacillus circumpalustris]|uniref:rhomboid family intramembrane serine protease n=1 Tax=Aurantibacillus circumpalustris TaxID=3036359 RepID=UPI00295BB155|nr:rhomboid family intramembrane serine protease [Aurantibacillus circumpalustris]